MGAITTLPIKKGKLNFWAFWSCVVLSLVLTNAPVVSWVLAPLTQFTTFVHELGHATACIITGGHVTGLTIVSDGHGHGGLTNCLGGWPFIYAQAGYLGTAMFGALLIYLCQFHRLAKGILCVLGGSFAMASIALVGANVLHTGWQGFFSFLWAMGLSGFLIWAGVKWRASAANLLVLFLAVQTALNSVTSLFDLTQFSMSGSYGSFSDATNMQSMTGIPAIVWALFWAATSVALVGFTMWRTYGFGSKNN
jgi:hypothetical protein